MNQAITLFLLAFVTAAAFADNSVETFGCRSKDGFRFEIQRENKGNIHLVSRQSMVIKGLSKGPVKVDIQNPVQKAGFEVRFMHIEDASPGPNQPPTAVKIVELEVRETDGKMMGTLKSIGDDPATREITLGKPSEPSEELKKGEYEISCVKLPQPPPSPVAQYSGRTVQAFRSQRTACQGCQCTSSCTIPSGTYHPLANKSVE